MPSRALPCVAACLAVGVGLLGGPAAGSRAPDTGGTLVRPVAGGACPDFPADNWWHADIRGLPVHARSDAWLRHMSPSSRLHPDFGDSFGAQPVLAPSFQRGLTLVESSSSVSSSLEGVKR